MFYQSQLLLLHFNIYMFLNTAVLQCSNIAQIQHKCPFQSRFPKPVIGSGYYKDSFHFYNLLGQTVEEVLWHREQVLYTPESAVLGNHTGTVGAPLPWEGSKAPQVKPPAQPCADSEPLDTFPSRRRPVCYLEPHSLLLAFQPFVHGLGHDEAHGCRQRWRHGTGRRRAENTGRAGGEPPPGGACAGPAPSAPAPSLPLRDRNCLKKFGETHPIWIDTQALAGSPLGCDVSRHCM